MTTTTEYLLGKKASNDAILLALKGLQQDALELATKEALVFTQFDDKNDKAKAMYYLGQKDILSALLWALDGTAEDDGCEPSIGVRTNA